MNAEDLLNIAIAATPSLLIAGAIANIGKPRWRTAQALGGLAFGASLLVLTIWLWHILLHDQLYPAHWASQTSGSLMMLTLVSFIGLINLLYSRQYMAGNPTQEAYYARWLMLTLAAVTLVVSANHMLVFLMAWVSISIGLHQLLMFFPDRSRAALAAHKKFIFARIAELSLLAGILLLHSVHDSWYISDIAQHYKHNNLDPGIAEQLAAALIVLTALIKCAQLPWHGWLIQVVEAPTPVSALLHAGIINLGGFLVIQFGALIMQSTLSQWLLLVVGGVTTVLAALVMVTRISIKVKLAWSTMSQMGLMLVECALGLFELALLHLLAHSCYKAYAFLNSGSEVEGYLKQKMSPPARPSMSQWTIAALISSALVIGVFVGLDFDAPYSPWLLLGIAMTLFIAERNGQQIRQSGVSMTLLAVALVSIYTLQKEGIGLVVGHLHPSAGWPADAWMGILFIMFSVIYLILRYRTHHEMTRRLAIALYAGFYLDEWVTRTTLKIWPTQLPVRSKPKYLDLAEEEMGK